MKTTPTIDYSFLGDVLSDYVWKDYKLIEVPWLVNIEHIRATAPRHCKSFELANRQTYDQLIRINGPNHLVGSAEQGFLSLDLPEGKYVGVTPCFRDEAYHNDLYQMHFMKIELFVRTDDEGVASDVLSDAFEVLSKYAGSPLEIVWTPEGWDLELNGIEIGSYGFRSHPEFGSWAYGTGLALPRFTVADDILSRG